jgi:hypothetical protein
MPPWQRATGLKKNHHSVYLEHDRAFSAGIGIGTGESASDRRLYWCSSNPIAGVKCRHNVGVMRLLDGSEQRSTITDGGHQARQGDHRPSLVWPLTLQRGAHQPQLRLSD